MSVALFVLISRVYVCYSPYKHPMGLTTNIQQLVTDTHKSVEFIEMGSVPKACSCTVDLQELVAHASLRDDFRLSFLGNGSEALVFKVDFGLLSAPFAIKLFYDSFLLKQEIAELLMKLLAGTEDTTELLCSPNNDPTWISNTDWHIRTLTSEPRKSFTRRVGSPKQNVYRSYWAHHIASSISPLVDSPLAGVCSEGELVGYAMPFYEGKFFSLGENTSLPLDTSTLEEYGILLDRSTSGYNAVALSGGECKIFDLKLRSEVLKFDTTW